MKQEILEHFKFAAKLQDEESSMLNGGHPNDNIQAVPEHVQVYHDGDNTLKCDSSP
jgi:hypothetical protein